MTGLMLTQLKDKSRIQPGLTINIQQYRGRRTGADIRPQRNARTPTNRGKESLLSWRKKHSKNTSLTQGPSGR